MMMTNKAVFLDRDGVINELVKRPEGHYTSPHKLEEVRYKPLAQEAVARLRKLGYKVLIVTNQPGIYYGDMTVFDMARICFAIKCWVGADDIYPAIFPMRANVYGNDNNDYKPASGGILNLIKKWDVDVKKSFMVGDRWKDIVPGARAGLTTIYVNNKPYESPYEFRTLLPDYTATSIWEAAELIDGLSQGRMM
jgi:D-glycero-D-manno-heptose 1,7-bisphosphate phosphatase